MAKYNIKKNWKSFKQTFEVSIKFFCRKWERETFPKWFFIYKQLDKCQNEYYPENPNITRFCRRTSLHVLMFPNFLLKKNLWSYGKWQTFEETIWPFFHNVRKEGFMFFKTYLFLIFVNKECFLKIYRDRQNQNYFS